MTDLNSLTDDELDTLRVAVLTEQERRQILATIPAQVDDLTRRYQLATGRVDGDDWRQPTSALDAYQLDAIVTHKGRSFQSLIPANVWEPGDPADPQAYRWWRDLDAPEHGDEWTPGRDCAVGDEVTYSGTRYRCLQAHTAQPGWEPPNTPALWEALGVAPDPAPAEPDPEPTPEPEPGPEPQPATPAWDPVSHPYKVGDEVTYDGKTYRARQAHTSQAVWTPTAVPSLWEPVA